MVPTNDSESRVLRWRQWVSETALHLMKPTADYALYLPCALCVD